MVQTGRRNRIINLFFGGATAAALGILIVPRAGSVLKDIMHISPFILGGTVVMGVAALLLRGEVWRVSLSAATGKDASRHELHAANSFGMLGASVNNYIGPPVRISLLRRLLPGQCPNPIKMLACDAPALLIEAGLAALLLASAIGAAGLAWWLPVAVIAIVSLLIGLLWSARRRWLTRYSFVEAFNLLARKRFFQKALLLVAATIMLQFGRTYLLLIGVGLHPAFWQVVVTFCTTGLLGALPLGPATSPGATMAVFGARSATMAAAAGMMMATAAFVAALVYAIWGLFVIIRHFAFVPKIVSLTTRDIAWVPES